MSPRNKHIFVVDDDLIVLFLLTKLITRVALSKSPLTFKNAAEALDTLRANYNEEDEFIIFLDINMVEMSGWDFLKAMEAFAKPFNTYVYIITSSVDKQDEDRANSYSFVKKLIVKPLRVESLIEIKEELA